MQSFCYFELKKLSKRETLYESYGRGFIFQCFNVSGGHALIINNELFDSSSPDRKGSTVDVKNLKTLFRKLGFKVRLSLKLEYFLLG
jgi:hypothetical protein